MHVPCACHVSKCKLPIVFKVNKLFRYSAIPLFRIPCFTDSPCSSSNLLSNSLSTKAFSEFLHVLAAHLPVKAKVPKTIRALKQFFMDVSLKCNSVRTGTAHADIEFFRLPHSYVVDVDVRTAEQATSFQFLWNIS